jgi:hypothetical protein
MSFNICLNNTWITLDIRLLLIFQRAQFFLETVVLYLVDESRLGGLEPVEERHEVTVAGVRVPVQVDLAGGAVVPEHLLCKPHLRLEFCFSGTTRPTNALILRNAVLWIRDIMVRIRILGSVRLSNGPGFGSGRPNNIRIRMRIRNTGKKS